MPFAGFPRDTLHTPTPDPLLGSLLEEIQDLAELKAILRGLWLLHRQRRNLRAVALDEFLSDPVLLRGIAPATESADAPEAIRRALRQSVRRGIFLAHETPDGQIWLALNNDPGRRALTQLKQTNTDPDPTSPILNPDEAPPKARPNIFALYEDTIGLLTPIIAERLQEAEQRYPPSWIQEAFELAALENKRSWNYIDAILKRWGSQGKSAPAGENYDDGKPGRNTPQDQRRKYREDYQRRRGASPRAAGGRS